MQNNTHLALTEQNETIALRTKAPVTPHLTAMPQRLYIVQKTCQRAVGSPRNTPKNIKFASYGVYTASIQHLRRASSCCSVFTARPQRSHGANSVLTVIIAFKLL